MGYSTCQGASVFGGGPTHRQRRTCDRCDSCPGCDPTVGRLKSDGEGGYYCSRCLRGFKPQPVQISLCRTCALPWLECQCPNFPAGFFTPAPVVAPVGVTP